MKKYFLSFCLLLATGMVTVVFNSCEGNEPTPMPPREIVVTGISLNKSTIALGIGQSETLIAIVTPALATNPTVTWTSNNPAIATVNADGRVTAIAEGTVTITAGAGNRTTECVVTVVNILNDEGVEIDGIVWATRNVDAPGTFAVLPESFGMFYQWNRGIGWSSSHPIIGSHGNNVWNNSTPAGTEWEAANDPCPQGWRVPTEEELQSLVDSDNTWTTINGVTGRWFGIAPNAIFLPAVGWRGNNGVHLNVGASGTYWSSTPRGAGAQLLSFGNSTATVGNDVRLNAFSVRCVAE